MPAKTRGRRRGWGFLRRLPSGRYQASYMAPDVVRHTAPTTFTLKSDAEHWLATERRLIERGEWTPPAQRSAQKNAEGVTLAAYGATWIDQRPLRPKSRAHYEKLLTAYIAPTPLGKTPIKNLTPQAVRAWHASVLPDKPVMRAHCYGLVHAICASAIKDGLLTANPCQVERAMKAPRSREPVILDVPEVAKLADAITGRLKALVLISAWCGLRWGEVTELRRKDVGPGAETISVARGVTHRGGCHVATPKSGRARVVVVPPHVRLDIEHHLKTYVAEALDSLLFPPVRGGCHLNDKVFREHFAAALSEIGRDGVTHHDLRHFCGSQTARVANLPETMARLGHSTVAASLIYQQVVSGRDAAVAQALSELAGIDTSGTP